jgi:hypothetical protein
MPNEPTTCRVRLIGPRIEARPLQPWHQSAPTAAPRPRASTRANPSRHHPNQAAQVGAVGIRHNRAMGNGCTLVTGAPLGVIARVWCFVAFGAVKCRYRVCWSRYSACSSRAAFLNSSGPSGYRTARAFSGNLNSSGYFGRFGIAMFWVFWKSVFWGFWAFWHQSRELARKGKPKKPGV